MFPFSASSCSTGQPWHVKTWQSPLTPPCTRSLQHHQWQLQLLSQKPAWQPLKTRHPSTHHLHHIPLQLEQGELTAGKHTDHKAGTKCTPPQQLYTTAHHSQCVNMTVLMGITMATDAGLWLPVRWWVGLSMLQHSPSDPSHTSAILNYLTMSQCSLSEAHPAYLTVPTEDARHYLPAVLTYGSLRMVMWCL
jgi:hypothetical protein